MIAAAADGRGPAHLSQLLDGDLSIPITVKQGEGLLEAVDVAGGDLPVRADPEGGGPGHNSSSAGGKPSTGQVGKLVGQLTSLYSPPSTARVTAPATHLPNSTPLTADICIWNWIWT